jgi:dipeptidyl aminopeptidase/acylaminoacyl peptidase
VTPVAGELTAWSSTGFGVHRGGIAGVAGGPVREAAVVHVSLEGGVTDVTPQPELPAAFLPVPEERVFTTADGETVPVVLYRPANPDFAAPEGELPPLLVHVHGGPTGQHLPVLDLELAYFTSRGIAVAAVNYGGSTGFGRAYRERLREQWGVVDVADCVAVAEALVAAGLADGDRLAVRGGSAGGFTAAASLTTTKTYRAGTVMYPLPSARQRYVERSPLANSASLAGPVLFQQGLEDRICPPEQADRFVAGLAGRGIPYAYQRFPGEQHGFRQAATIVAALEAELSFYGQVLGFETPGVARLELAR